MAATRGLTDALSTLGSSIVAQNKRMLVISQNIAHVGARSQSKDEDPYRRQLIQLKTEIDPTTKVELVKVDKVLKDMSPFILKYDPSDPTADSKGFIKTTNVEPMVELIDMQETGHAHTANIKTLERVLSMLQATIGLMKAI